MIQLTRLNNQALIVNCDLIKFVETAPDTVLTLVSGEKLLVRESPDEVLQRILVFRRDVLTGEGLYSARMKSDSLRENDLPPRGPRNG